jgi:hypothetical protein
MAGTGEVSYLKRFAVKFVEMAAAGIGTAVTGYLVAYVTGHFSLFMPAAVEPASSAPQAISRHAAEPRDDASIEATVRAALANHGGSEAAPVVAAAAAQPITSQTMAPASPETTASVPAVAPPLAAAEIGSLPVAAVVDSPLPAEPDGWPTDPTPVSGAGRLPAAPSLGMLPPQPPPVNGNLLAALKHFF